MEPNEWGLIHVHKSSIWLSCYALVLWYFVVFMQWKYQTAFIEVFSDNYVLLWMKVVPHMWYGFLKKAYHMYQPGIPHGHVKWSCNHMVCICIPHYVYHMLYQTWHKQYDRFNMIHISPGMSHFVWHIQDPFTLTASMTLLVWHIQKHYHIAWASLYLT